MQKNCAPGGGLAASRPLPLAPFPAAGDHLAHQHPQDAQVRPLHHACVPREEA